MDGSEATFSVETPIASQDYLWSDKYRPRKPTYLNRVMTGFDWNKYNQTHYDMDNPPPKIVQGYKFNVSSSSKNFQYFFFRFSILISLINEKLLPIKCLNVMILILQKYGSRQAHLTKTLLSS